MAISLNFCKYAKSLEMTISVFYNVFMESLCNAEVHKIDTTTNNSSITTAYDDVFRTLLNDCSSLIIPVINELFHTKYALNEHITLCNNELFINHPDGTQAERITDSNIQLRKGRYHIECQSSTDKTILIRIFEYDSQIALQNSTLENNVLTVCFPSTAVIYLRNPRSTPDELKLVIQLSDDSCEGIIPILKIQTYTIEEIFEKRLFFLIPFHIFVYEKDFKEYETDEQKLLQFRQQYSYLLKRLDECVEKGELTEYTKVTLIEMSKKVLRQIAQNYSNIEKGVSDVMGGKILDYEAKDILNAGISQGISQGKILGLSQSLLTILQMRDILSDNIQNRILEETDIITLQKWIEFAMQANSTEQFLLQMDI